MHKTHYLLLPIIMALSLASAAAPIRISRSVYEDRLRTFWLAQVIANWTGLKTELHKCNAPFYTNADWSRFGFVLDQNPWLADDDTDIEYVYCHLLQKHQTTMLSPQQIRQGWIDHINRYIWVSNNLVRGLFNQGILPPATSLPAVNWDALQIDAQLTTEVFGALAPGMPHKALEMANLPILTTAFGHAAHASQFHVILHSLAMLVDTTQPPADQMIWLVREARKYFPDSSKVSHMVDFVLADYLANPDKNNWEQTRDRIHQQYQSHASANGWRYIGCVESSVNFAAGICCLLYGEGDYKKTVRIGTLGGWDSDNPTATMGGLLGLMYGYNKFVAHFDGRTFSDRYNIYRTRDNLPDYLPNDPEAQDTFLQMARRMLTTIDTAVVEAGGSIDPAGYWLVPAASLPEADANPLLQLTARSANLQVPRQGGTVTPASSITGSSLGAITDGIEHDFGGREYFGPHPQFSAQGSELTLSVTYSREVEVHTIRFIKGNSTTGFTGVSAVEVLDNGQWREPSGGYTASAPMNASQRYQIVDFELSAPLTARGIRLRGPLNGRCDVLELDVLSPQPSSGTTAISATAPMNAPRKGFGTSALVPALGHPEPVQVFDIQGRRLPHGLCGYTNGNFVVRGLRGSGAHGNHVIVIQGRPITRSGTR